MENVNIRVVSPDDAQRLLEIYAPYVEKTAITFEYDVPSVHEFKKRIEHTLEKYPYLVAEIGDEIVGLLTQALSSAVRHTVTRRKRRFMLTGTTVTAESEKSYMKR